MKYDRTVLASSSSSAIYTLYNDNKQHKILYETIFYNENLLRHERIASDRAVQVGCCRCFCIDVAFASGGDHYRQQKASEHSSSKNNNTSSSSSNTYLSSSSLLSLTGASNSNGRKKQRHHGKPLVRKRCSGTSFLSQQQHGSCYCISFFVQHCCSCRCYCRRRQQQPQQQQ
jgi:hypothetical protein